MQANRLLEAKDVQIGGNIFHIFPFSAFKAANLTGELAAVILPLLSSLAPLFGETNGKESLLDMDLEKAAPQVGVAFSALSGDKVEVLLRKLLLQPQKISVEAPGEEAQWLTEQNVDAVFGGNVQDMFLLAFYVIQVNFSGFFERFGSLSGKAADTMTKMMTSAGLGPSM